MKRAVSFLFLCVFLARCTPDMGGDDYGVADAGDMTEVLKGKVVSRRSITINNKTAEDKAQEKGNAGSGIGAATGGLSVGIATKSPVGGVVGALAGGMLGQVVGNKMTDQKGFQYIVSLDDGRTISVSQGAKPELAVNQRVLVLQGKERTRIIPDESAQPSGAAS